MKKRKFFLTINNYSDLEVETAKAAIKECSYGIYAKEVGEMGTPHLHIWLHYKHARSFNAINKKFSRANIQEGRGKDQDQTYLKKDDDYEEYGEMEQQGSRTDIHKVKELVKAGGNMRDVIEIANSYQAIKGAELIFKYIESKRRVHPIKVIWFFGTSGSGKTKSVFDTEVDIFRPTSYKWWEGYDGHKTVLIDDYRPEWCSFDKLLKITDIYPFRVQTKGGSREVQYDKIYFTSFLHPRDYFADIEEAEFKQLTRRVTEFKEFGTEV